MGLHGKGPEEPRTEYLTHMTQGEGGINYEPYPVAIRCSTALLPVLTVNKPQKSPRH